MAIPQFLREIKSNLKAGRLQRRAGLSLLAEYGYQRRRQTFVDAINADLAAIGLYTDPEITTEMPLRTPQIRIQLSDGLNHGAKSEAAEVGQDQEPDLSDVPAVTEFRLADLEAAERMPVCVGPDDDLSKAFTKMQLHDYSQLVVTDGHGRFKGTITLKSILVAKITGTPSRVRDCIDEEAITAPSSMKLEDAISVLRNKSCLVVTAQSQQVRGIVTSFDLAEEFVEIVAPFKRIEEIEIRLKQLIAQRFTAEALGIAMSDGDDKPEPIEVNELTFGDLLILLQNPDHWKTLKIPEGYDQKEIVAELDKVRKARNDLMHFREIGSLVEELGKTCSVIRQFCPD